MLCQPILAASTSGPAGPRLSTGRPGPLTLEWAWTAMDQPSDYSATWRDYRKRRFVSWVVFLSYMPGAMATFLGFGLPLSSMTGIKPDYFFFAIAGTWMLAVIVTNLRAVSFPCPVAASASSQPGGIAIHSPAAYRSGRCQTARFGSRSLTHHDGQQRSPFDRSPLCNQAAMSVSGNRLSSTVIVTKRLSRRVLRVWASIG